MRPFRNGGTEEGLNYIVRRGKPARHFQKVELIIHSILWNPEFNSWESLGSRIVFV